MIRTDTGRSGSRFVEIESGLEHQAVAGAALGRIDSKLIAGIQQQVALWRQSHHQARHNGQTDIEYFIIEIIGEIKPVTDLEGNIGSRREINSVLEEPAQADGRLLHERDKKLGSTAQENLIVYILTATKFNNTSRIAVIAKSHSNTKTGHETPAAELFKILYS